MKVSIITVSYNSETTISHTIESILSQTYNNIEYVIIDGASTDHTILIAEAYRKEFQERNIDYRIISEKDSGMYDALNKGVKIASGELVGSINSDDYYESDAVEKMVRHYIEDDYDVAWGNIRVVMSNSEKIKRAHVGKLWTTNGWCHPAMFAKKSVLEKYPYACKNMYDDFNFVTDAFCDGCKIRTYDELISNFSFGGMSTQKSLSDVRKRVGYRWDVYKVHGFSCLYYLYCWIVELVKYYFS